MREVRWNPAHSKLWGSSPFRKPYGYINIFKKYSKNGILYQKNIDREPMVSKPTSKLN
jgi:hypothetical protein